jgi:hypothetical protein
MHNTIGRLLFGKHYIPSPENGESVADAIERNRRAIDYSNTAAKHLPSMIAPAASLNISAAMDDPAFMRSFGRMAGSPEEADFTIDNLVKKMHKRGSLLKRAVERLKGGLGDCKPDNVFSKKRAAQRY